MSKRRKAFTLRDLAAALNQAARYVRWEREIIEQFHSYAHEYGCSPGRNVFQFVLDDARRMRRIMPASEDK
jgi:hypothetical protein